MVAWNEYKGIARERGALAFEVFIVQSTPAAGPEAVKENLPDHLAYQRTLESNGSLMLAGPISDESGEEMQGAGMVILRAASMEDAKALADNDPMHKSGARNYVLRKWLLNEGSLSVNVGLSTGAVSLT